MGSIGGILLDKEILLESGTNELEVLVFDVAGCQFGINVAKVREVLPRGEITSLAKAHPSVRGVFRLREQVVPCVSLVDHLSMTSTGKNAESTLILTDFNNQQTAFLVDGVERIHRLSWEQVLSMPPLAALRNTPVTSVVHCDNRLVVMLDFEMIIDQVTKQAYRARAVENTLNLPRESLRIVLCDDSPTIRQAVTETLCASGYTQLEVFENGAKAWQWLAERISSGADRVADLVISDVEMPQIDGLHLTKRIKEHPRLKGLPVLLYSSIITPDNFKKGESVGADMQVSKPDLHKVVEMADRLIAKSRGASPSSTEVHAPTSEASPPIVTEPVAPKTTSGANRDSAAPQAEPTTTPVRPKAAAKPSKSKAPAAATNGQSNAGLKTAPPTENKSAAASNGHAPAPRGKINPRLWQTFRIELAEHVANISERLIDAAAGRMTSEGVRDLLRTLHTVKSAAMVVPLEPITRATHAVESLLSPLRERPNDWPQDVLVAFANWLETLTNPLLDPNEMFDSTSEWKRVVASIEQAADEIA